MYPAEEIGTAAFHRQSNDFRQFIGMQGADCGLDLGIELTARLDQHRHFCGGFDRALPAVYGNTLRKQVDASGQPALDQGIGNPARDDAIRHIGQHDDRSHGPR